MSNRIFEKGRQGFADGSLDWDTNSFKAVLESFVADTHIKAITNATNANPIAYTVTSHGWSVGDIVVILLVGGNLAANGTYKIGTVVDANTLNLLTVADGLAVQGSAAYTSGGVMINMTQATNRADIDAGQVGTPVALTTPTVANGVLDADDPTFTSVTGAQCLGMFIYKDTGVAATDRLAIWQDGRCLVTVAADAASSATTVWVEPLAGAIPSGTSLVFSNGKTAVLSAPAAAGARSLTVGALANAIAAGNTSDAPTTNNNLPVTPNGGNITITFDSGNNRIAKL